MSRTDRKMPFAGEGDEIECRIIESYGIFSQGIRFWNKELNLVSWNGMPAKLDIRNWQRDHQKCGKGIAITREEAEELVKLLGEILKKKPRTEKAGNRASKGPDYSKGTYSTKGSWTSDGPWTAYNSDAYKKPEVPKTLEPFYKELKLVFGAGPDACKTARNALLKKYHPDISTGNKAYATRRTIQIKEAYERIIAWWNENKG